MNAHSSAARTPRQRYWVRTRRLTLALLLVWFFGTFGILFFARELSNFTFFGWPLSFYLAAQGMVIGYTVIVAIYAFKMRKLDQSLENKNSNGIE
jgi:putative solute:sodium symporter small subunit